MGDRDTLIKIQNIMRRLLLVIYDPVGPIPRKGTTRHECYRALWEIQELLHTNRYFTELPPTTNADVTPIRHGRWLEIVEHGGPNRLRHQEIYAAVYRCSVCNEEAFNYDYCPNCGAKMDGGEA